MMLVTFTIWAMRRYESVDGHYVFSPNITNKEIFHSTYLSLTERVIHFPATTRRSRVTQIL